MGYFYISIALLIPCVLSTYPRIDRPEGRLCLVTEYALRLGEFLKENRRKKEQHDKSWYLVIAVAMAVGVLAMIILSSTLQMFACALLIGTAATLVGAFAGFVFGIPKTVSSSAGNDATQNAALKFRTNTNLEDISDWLTKILVGAGLVELNKVLDIFKSFGTSFNPPLGKGDNLAKLAPLGNFGWVVAPALVITYSICGFLLAYLWARIYMTSELERHEAALRLAITGSPDSTGISGAAADQAAADKAAADKAAADKAAADKAAADEAAADKAAADKTAAGPAAAD
jgi:hypothetical protein